MERKIQSHGERLKRVLLYRDDIERIVELLREVSPNVELSTDEHKFSDVKEWADMKKDYFTNMQVAARNPYISLDLSKSSVWLYIAEDTPQSRGAFEKIKRFLMDRKPPGQSLLNFWMPPLVLNLWWIPLNLAIWRKNWALLTVSGIFMLGCVGWWWLAFRARLVSIPLLFPNIGLTHRTSGTAMLTRLSLPLFPQFLEAC